MKRVRYELIAATLLGLLLTGCSNFGLRLGGPTVSVQSELLNWDETTEKDDAGNVVAIINTIQYDIFLNALPASPAGIITLKSGSAEVFSASIPSCPATEKDYCPNRFERKVKYRRGPADPPPAGIQVTSYIAQSLNETVQYEQPVNNLVYVY